MLSESPKPYGDLFGQDSEKARLAISAMVVLRQHLEEPGILLPILSEVLKNYQDFQIGLYQNPPSWFLTEEVPLFEKLADQKFVAYLSNLFRLSDQANARKFAGEEALSGKLAGLVPFEIKAQTDGPLLPENEFSLDKLIPRFKQVKRDLEILINSMKNQIERLSLTPLKNLSILTFTDLFVKKGFARIDGLDGQLQSLMKDIEGPARKDWQNIPEFSKRWETEKDSSRKLIEIAFTLQKNFDYHFGRFVETRFLDRNEMGTFL